MRLLLPVLALLALAPLAGGSWGPPPAFTDVVWLDEARVVTNDPRLVGVYSFDPDRFEPFPNASSSIAPRPLVTPSPDGRWVVYAYGHPQIPRPSYTSGDVMPGATAVYDAATKERVWALDSGATALAAGPRHLAYAHWTEGLVLVPWGSWDDRRTLATDEVEGWDITAVRQLAFAGEETRLLALLSNGTLPDRVVVFDLATGGARTLRSPTSNLDLLEDPSGVCCAGSPALHLVVAPQGDAFAFGLGSSSGPSGASRLVLHDLATLQPRANVSHEGTLAALAWGEAGLASSWTVPKPDGSGFQSTVRLHDGALREIARVELPTLAGTLAWSPSGERLAAGENGALRLYDARLGHVSTHAMQPHGDSMPEGPSAKPREMDEPPLPQERQDVGPNGTAPTEAPHGETPHRPTPGFEAAAGVGLVAGLALALARRRRG